VMGWASAVAVFAYVRTLSSKPSILRTAR
jgi:hypothetical protein